MIIWLASYPKSGNTWLRSIISSLIYTENGIFDFKLLDKIGQFPLRKYFINYTNKFNDINEISKYWIPAQNKINLDNQIKFLKTHNLLCTINNNSFTDKHNTLATIYVVRDPRNLVSSISNHFKESIEGSTKFLSDPSLLYESKFFCRLSLLFLASIEKSMALSNSNLALSFFNKLYLSAALA